MDTAKLERTDTTSPMNLLAAGVPLSLLLDLAGLDLAGSKEIAQVERADASWVHAA
ncbi:MAG: hypothetical protein ACJ735_02320 [Actinomycetes bacterium]